MDRKLTATELATVYDLRRHRATMFTAAVMKALGDILDPDERHPNKRRDAHDRLFGLFHEEGFDAITDLDRQKAGLEKRGELGWTNRELRILENTRVLSLLQPVQPILARSTALDELGKLDGELLEAGGK